MTAPVGSLAEEAALLAAVLRDRAAGGDHRDGDARCTGCPLCRVSTALETSAPQLAAAAGVAFVAVRDLLRTARAAYDTAVAPDPTAGEERRAWR